VPEIPDVVQIDTDKDYFLKSEEKAQSRHPRNAGAVIEKNVHIVGYLWRLENGKRIWADVFGFSRPDIAPAVDIRAIAEKLRDAFCIRKLTRDRWPQKEESGVRFLHVLSVQHLQKPDVWIYFICIDIRNHRVQDPLIYPNRKLARYIRKVLGIKLGYAGPCAKDEGGCGIRFPSAELFENGPGKNRQPQRLSSLTDPLPLRLQFSREKKQSDQRECSSFENQSC